MLPVGKSSKFGLKSDQKSLKKIKKYLPTKQNAFAGRYPKFFFPIHAYRITKISPVVGKSESVRRQVNRNQSGCREM